MSFVCQICGKSQRDGSIPTLIQTECRDKVYPERRDKEDKIIDKGGSGYETVREVQACKQCADNEQKEKEK